MRYSTFLKENYNILIRILDKMETGIWITDGKCEVIMMNIKSIGQDGIARNELIGKKMTELVDIGYIMESASLKTMRSYKKECIIEKLGTGGYCVVTSSPLFYEGELDLIICVEQNISDMEKLKDVLTEQLDIKEKEENKLSGFQIHKTDAKSEFITRNVNMMRIRDMAAEIGRKNATVVITGEAGAGKEAIADIIYRNSRRVNAPFIKVNCAAIPKSLMDTEFFGYEQQTFAGSNRNGRAGIFELADGGTLFLDEVGELSPAVQSELLKVIQKKEVRRLGGEKDASVDVRIIASTSRDLKKEIEKGNFRRDLYYRLFIVSIDIPPLSERKEDIEPLAKHFLSIFNKEYKLNKTISDDAIAILKNHSWPGNVSELRNVVKRLVISAAGDRISEFQAEICLNKRKDVISEITAKEEGIYLEQMMNEFEKEIIATVYKEVGSMTGTAKLLHVDKSTISRKMKKHRLKQ